jgi:Flp pilus assembly protein TadG
MRAPDLGRIFDFLRRERGSTAAEFALVLPVFLLLTLGTIGICTLLYTMATLHYAVEDAARCASIKTAVCGSGAATAAYAASRYSGPPAGVTFTPTLAACGNKVTATATFNLHTGVATFATPISATACYPLNG